MNNAAPAVTVVESAPTAPAFDPGDQHTWSPEQREQWNKDGNIPTPPKQDSAPAKDAKEQVRPPAESAPAKEPTDAAGAEPAKDQEYKARTEKRFTEVLDEVKRLKQELADARKPRETAAPPPAPKAKTAKELAEEYFKANPGKDYEDWLDHRAREIAHEINAERDKQAAEAAVTKDLTEKFSKLKERYPDADKIFPTVNQIMADKGIPEAVKAAVSRSPQMEHLLYVLSGDEKTVQHFIQTAKSDPLQAVRLIFQMEQDIKSELEKGGSGKEVAAELGKETPARGEDGKFQKAPEEPKPRAPKPPPEVGGKGAAPEDPLRAAAAANDFRAFEAEENHRRFASK